MEDLYEILGVPRNASQADIKKAFRQLAREYHPDSHPGDKAIEEKFKKINAAYSVLNDPEKRARYDQFGTADGNSNPFSGMGGADIGDLFGDVFAQVFGGGFGGFGGSRRQNPNAPRQGEDIEQVEKITLLEASTGITRDIEVTRSDKCQHCNGTGAKPGTTPETCPRCHGQGQVKQTQQSLFGQFVSITTCPECKGKGKIIREKCDECHGRGTIRKKHALEVKIPAGIERGMRLKIPHAGEDGINDGPPGDLFLIIDVEKHPDFERDGPDLHENLILTYPQAVLGTSVNVKTIDGNGANIDIPSGTYHGQVFKVKGRGMPKINSSMNAKGDLYVHAYVEIPKQLTEKQRELIKALADEMKTPVNSEPGFFDRVKNFFS